MTFAHSSRGASVELSHVSKSYGDYTVLDDISLIVQPGEFMSFLGPSGSGKTTTLNLIAGFTGLSSGAIQLADRSIGNLPPHKRNIGVVFQHYALFPHMTVADNVAYPLRQRKIAKTERDRIVRLTLAKVKLEAFAERYPGALSGGQQQRVALARAMVFSPPLLLMDEPLGALDKQLRESLQLEIKRIHRELGSTFVYVTHDQEEALVLSDRIAVFHKGRIEQVGSGMELYLRPKTLFVGQFIGESSVLYGPHRISDGRTIFEICQTTIQLAALPTADGTQAVLLRPEDLVVLKAGSGVCEGRCNRLPGRVRERLYLGASIKYEVLLLDGTVVTARMPAQNANAELGDGVEVAFSPHQGLLLARE